MTKSKSNGVDSTAGHDSALDQWANPNMIQQEGGGGGVPYIAPSIAVSMKALAEYLATDVAAAWALAGDLAGGNVALQGTIFGFSSVGMGVLAVGKGAFAATTWVDNYLHGALHEGVVGAVEMVAHMDPGEADPYFGGDGFTVDDTRMMSSLCSNWNDYWEDVSVKLVAPIPNVLA